MNTVNSIYSFLTGSLPSTIPVCTTETLGKAFKAIISAKEKFGNVSSQRELIKMTLEDNLLIAKCMRLMAGLSAIVPKEERIPALTKSPIIGYAITSQENIFTIAEDLAWENSLPGMVVDAANRAFSSINIPTGLALTAAAIAAGALGLYALSQSKKAV